MAKLGKPQKEEELKDQVAENQVEGTEADEDEEEEMEGVKKVKVKTPKTLS